MQAPTKIAVAGATGRVGHHVVEVLEARGHDVVPMSRSQGVDVITGTGLAAALADVECVIDAATAPSPDQDAATEFFTTAAPEPPRCSPAGGRAANDSGVHHRDRPVHRGLRRREARPRAGHAVGPDPVRVLRAAQFHEFVAQLVEWGTQGEVSYVPKMRTQLVAARTVAEALADLATEPGPTKTPFTEVAGPREENLVEMATLLASRRGHPLKIEGVSNPTDPDHELNENGALLPGPGAILAGPTFEEWLDSTP
jgi:uncharacterized protein YbjT (DUF2867 family)